MLPDISGFSAAMRVCPLAGNDIVTAMAGTLIPADVAESAFDIVHNSLLQKRVSDYVNDNLSIWQTIGAPVSVPLQAFGKIVDLNFVVTVTFSDGSTAKFALTGLEGSLTEIHYTFEFVKGSARDADDGAHVAATASSLPFRGQASVQRGGSTWLAAQSASFVAAPPILSMLLPR